MKPASLYPTHGRQIRWKAPATFYPTSNRNGEVLTRCGGCTGISIPGATKDELKNAPLSKLPKDAKVKVQYCSKDGVPVEVKVDK